SRQPVRSVAVALFWREGTKRRSGRTCVASTRSAAEERISGARRGSGSDRAPENLGGAGPAVRGLRGEWPTVDCRRLHGRKTTPPRGVKDLRPAGRPSGISGGISASPSLLCVGRARPSTVGAGKSSWGCPSGGRRRPGGAGARPRVVNPALRRRRITHSCGVRLFECQELVP